MSENHKLELPKNDSAPDSLLSSDDLSAAIKAFEERYPGVIWQTADNEAIKQYTVLAWEVARHLTALHYEIASMIYNEHIPLFTAMGDSAILCAVACLHFSKAEGEQAKRDVMKNLKTWSIKLPSHCDGNWLSRRWEQIFGKKKTEELLDLWDKLWELYQFYLSRPEWG